MGKIGKNAKIGEVWRPVAPKPYVVQKNLPERRQSRLSATSATNRQQNRLLPIRSTLSPVCIRDQSNMVDFVDFQRSRPCWIQLVANVYIPGFRGPCGLMAGVTEMSTSLMKVTTSVVQRMKAVTANNSPSYSFKVCLSSFLLSSFLHVFACQGLGCGA